jgi:hypothetical protein
MVCLGNICINTLHKGAKGDDDDDAVDNNFIYTLRKLKGDDTIALARKK